jgi:YbbR domain-containing protein
VKQFFTRNLGWKLLSLAAAILLWIAVASEPELSAFISVPVEYKNLAPDVELNSDIVESVFLEVRGPSGELRDLPEARRRYAVILDMTGVGAGQRTFAIDRTNVRLPRGIELVRAIPAQIRLDFERGETRTVPVNARFAPGLPPDMKVVQVVPDPPSVTIAGPASRVARVASVETDPIRLLPEAGTAVYRADVYPGDSRVRIQDARRVTVKVTVEKN